jgi:menaquinone-9 beta-reductase
MASRFSNPVDVLVVGGGPAGLATAIAARRHDLTVAVADGAIPPIDKSCGEGLMPDAVEALSHLGVTIPKGAAYPFRGIRFLNDGAKAEASFRTESAYGIRRTHLHRILVDHAETLGVRMFWQNAVTGLHPEGAMVSGDLMRARWVVGADGVCSRVRRWAKLDPQETLVAKDRRFGFRSHYRTKPWTDFMELHWGHDCQIYVTPISQEEICVALVSQNSKLRLEDALEEFPELSAHLIDAVNTSNERGAITATRTPRKVYEGRTVLVGDASGGVDAITGEGLCLAFRQSALLGDCLASGDLARYQTLHRRLLRRPAFMARMMVFISKHSSLRKRAMRVFEASPRSFAAMLALHTGEGSARDHLCNGIALGWDLLRA